MASTLVRCQISQMADDAGTAVCWNMGMRLNKMIVTNKRRIFALLSVTTLFAVSCGGGSDSSTGEADGYKGLDESALAGEVSAFGAGLDESSIKIGDQTFAATGASFSGDELVLLVEGGMAVVELDDEGPTGLIMALEDGAVWQVDEGGEVAATLLPEDLGGEGDLFVVEAQMVSLGDGSLGKAEVAIHLGLIGSGTSELAVEGEYALVTGTLGTRTYVQVRDLIEDHPEVTTLVLQQIDGSENDEVNVWTGRLIRDAGLTTYVPRNGDVSSGGVDLFAAGATRILEPGAFVGVHSWSNGDGTMEGADFPREHPVHKTQLAYFTEMLGEVAGPEFYFYTLAVSPAAEIHRMTDDELVTYPLTNAHADPDGLPSELVGLPAMYAELLPNAFEKFAVTSCEVVGDSIEFTATSSELGDVTMESIGSDGVLTLDDHEGDSAIGVMSQLVFDGDQVTGELDIDLPNYGIQVDSGSIVVACSAP